MTPNPVNVDFEGDDEVDLRVVTGSTCAWTVTSQASWISVRGAAGGTGNGSARLNVASTLQVDARVGTVTVGSQPVTVRQAGILNQEVTIRGTVRSLSGSCPNRSFTINGSAVVVNSDTNYPGSNECSDLESGESARVRGVGQSNGTIRATRVDQIGGDSDSALLGLGAEGGRP